MDTGPKPARAKQAWTNALIVVSIIASGVVVAGLLHEPPAPELTTAPPTPTAEPPPPVPQQEFAYTSEPVEYPTTIPGCEVVEPPAESEHVAFGFATYDRPTYDDPRLPWLTGPKATALSDALVDQLPNGAALELAPPSSSLVFQPMLPVPEDQLPEGYSPEDFGSTTAWGSVRNGGAPGRLRVTVGLSDSPPPCAAGRLDERRVLEDGTVLDTLDTWSAVNDVRTLERQATAYHPDGSLVSASATDTGPSDADGKPANSGSVPLTLDELADIVTTPRLRVSTPVPPGTPSPAPECEVYTEGSERQVTQEDLDRLGTALESLALDGLATDRPLRSLQVTGFRDAFCTSVNVTTPGREATLELSVAGGQRPPEQYEPDPSAGDTVDTRTLDDGTVVTRSQWTAYGAEPDALHSVTATRPGGTQVRVSSRAAGAAEPLPLDLLETIALTPGLEL